MADLTADFDGNMTLEQTKNSCQVEQDGGFQLQIIKFGTITAGNKVLLVNNAEFKSKPIGRLKNLLFTVVGSNDPAKLRKENEGQGWTFICDSQIYITENVTRVMVFGKKS